MIHPLVKERLEQRPDVGVDASSESVEALCVHNISELNAKD
jgi:hypothetical protein